MELWGRERVLGPQRTQGEYSNMVEAVAQVLRRCSGTCKLVGLSQVISEVIG